MLKQGLLFLAPLSSLATSYFKPGDQVTQRSTTLCHSGIRDRAFAFDTVEEEGQDDGDLLDTVVVVSVDGAFHGLNRTTGAELWTSTPSATPLVRIISSTLDRTYYAIEPQTGALFVLPTAEEEEVENLGISVAQLVDYSPFTLAEPQTGKPERIFVGVKKHTSLDIDIVSGELRSDSRRGCDASNDLHSRSSSSTVSILRTDYDVKVIAPNNRTLQQLSYSEISTAHDHAHSQASSQYLLADPNGYVWSFGTNNTSRKVPRFSHPIVAAFDLCSTATGPVAVLQESSPRLLTSDMKRHLNAVSDRVYIGRIEETYFAMSVSKYPLVALTSHENNPWNDNLIGRWRTRGSSVPRGQRLLAPVYTSVKILGSGEGPGAPAASGASEHLEQRSVRSRKPHPERLRS